jgi:hypothetical protein
MEFLAVYSGPNGPISVLFEASDLTEAAQVVEDRRQSWFDDAENYLDLPFEADNKQIDAELDARGWTRIELTVHDYDLFTRP